ncbi:MAG: hypothetical protein CVU92_09900 [Firmicutes bacterium HGW-Firmicutes-17]|jgi:restriction endonuclease S subunit|nr:MAG: hypothetical protein CVU92_09900 [Firmicutes bacterium HGW-Firmicutes-17]
MAKKKKQELTSVELLAEALVREEDWPYEVPENWVWVRLGALCQVKGGKRLPKGHHLVDDKTEYPYIRVTNFNEHSISVDEVKYIRPETYEKISRYTISKDDIYISIAGTIGKVGIIPDCLNGGNLTENAAKITNLNGLTQKYLLYTLTSTNIQHQISKSTISTTQPKLALFRIEDLVVPLPPLAEQQRIIDRIESLFEQLNQAKDLIQAALDSFETRKAAILHQAFTGQLTKKWREAHGVGMESWEEKYFGEIGTLERGRSKHRPRNTPELFGGDYPFIQTGDVANANIFIKEHKKNLSELGLKQSRLFPKGTLCITIAANIGDVAILDYDCCFPDSVVGFTPNVETISKFIYYYMCVIKADLEHFAPATAQKNINLRILNEIQIKMPSYKEQQEIVRILDDLFAKEQNAKDLCDLIDQIETIKKTILGKAFRGELGTNEAGEENAAFLLKKN